MMLLRKSEMVSTKKNVVECFLLLTILSLGAYFRFLNNSSYPGLYNDEGTQINIAINFMQGKTEYLGIRDSLLLVMRMPLFPFLLSILFRIFSPGLQVARSFSAILSVITIGLTFFTVKSIFGAKGIITGLLAALALAVYPKVVMLNRLGISYNLLAPLVLVHFLGMCKYWQTRKISWMILASVAIGVGGLVDLVSFTLVPGFLLVVLLVKRRDTLIGLGLIILPFLMYGISIIITAPAAFLSDFQFFLFRVSGDSLLIQLGRIILNFGSFFIREGWVLLGLSGLFLLSSLEEKRIAILIFLLPIIIISRTTDFSIGYYYLVPWIPILSIGVGRFFELGIVKITQTFQPMMEIKLSKINNWEKKGERTKRFLAAVVPALIIFILVLIPVIVSIFALNFQIKFHTPHQILNYSDDIQGAQIIQDYINNHIKEDDVVLASPAIAWMLKGKASDYQIALAASGLSTIHLPPIPVERLAFPLSVQNARFIVVDAIWLEWGESDMPGLVDIRTNLEDTWWLVLEVGKFSVYENPNF